MIQPSHAAPSSVGTKATCPICYEDLNPLAEDLLSISVCGHVFHDLCLQQWQEYCPKGKKCTCPVCKQAYSARDVIKLFFQSSGEKITQSEGVNEKTLSREVETLQGKVFGLNSALDAQKLRVGELNSEVTMWRNRAEKEEKLKSDYLIEKETIHQLLQRKEAELRKISEDCIKSRESSLALAKELAALKLAMDVNLGEEEISKLVGMGKGKTSDAVDVLQRSLLLRNKCYKELMAQCNSLGRAETRALKKLEKSEERIKMLKVQLHELEKTVEKKDCEILSILKKSNQKSPKNDFEMNRDFSNEDFVPSFPSSGMCISIDDDDRVDDLATDHCNMNDVASSDKFVDHDEGFYTIPMIRIADKSPVNSSKMFSDSHFPSSLIGVEDTTKHPKWLKANPSTQTSNIHKGLIALGADGRGGTVKVLRAQDKFSEGKAHQITSKPCKRPKTLSVKSKSQVNIEQYFGKP